MTEFDMRDGRHGEALRVAEHLNAQIAAIATEYSNLVEAADAVADAFEDLLSYADMEFIQQSDDAVEEAIETTRAKIAAYRKERGDA